MDTLLQNIMQVFGYEKTTIYFGSSIVYDCSFYKTEFENVFITFPLCAGGV